MPEILWKAFFQSSRLRQRGQGMVEYALIIVLVAVVVVVILGTLGGTIKGVFTDINKSLGG
jgi:pilus assembly protein Flp/PilA